PRATAPGSLRSASRGALCLEGGYDDGSAVLEGFENLFGRCALLTDGERIALDHRQVDEAYLSCHPLSLFGALRQNLKRSAVGPCCQFTTVRVAGGGLLVDFARPCCRRPSDVRFRGSSAPGGLRCPSRPVLRSPMPCTLHPTRCEHSRRWVSGCCGPPAWRRRLCLIPFP